MDPKVKDLLDEFGSIVKIELPDVEAVWMRADTDHGVLELRLVVGDDEWSSRERVIDKIVELEGSMFADFPIVDFGFTEPDLSEDERASAIESAADSRVHCMS